MGRSVANFPDGDSLEGHFRRRTFIALMGSYARLRSAALNAERVTIVEDEGAREYLVADVDLFFTGHRVGEVHARMVPMKPPPRG